MDTFLLITLLWWLFVYAITQIFLLRHIPEDTAPLWQGRIAAFLCIGSLVSDSVLFSRFLQSWSSLSVSALVVTILLGLLISMYLLSIYSYSQSSISLRLLYLIGKNRKGVSLKELLSQYNLEQIVDRRLQLFLSTGALSFNGKKYYRTGRISPFSIRQIFFKCIDRIFPE